MIIESYEYLIYTAMFLLPGYLINRIISLLVPPKSIEETDKVLPYSGYSLLIQRGQWQGRNYEPSPGDIIFFDWEGDGLADHVGIVEKGEHGLIYTIEGNTGDACAERHYTHGAAPICGYGLPNY